MATNVTYSSLINDVTNYLERGASAITDNTVFQQIPRLINATERKIIQTLKLQGTVEVLVDPVGLVAGVSIVSKPDRWRQTKELNYGAGAAFNSFTPLYPRGYGYCRRYWPDDSLTGAPKFYSDYDYGHWLVVPTPDLTYPLEANCYMQPVLLDDGNQENFFTTYTPNCLLYGTLLEATPFLKDDERIATWKAFWDYELQTLSGQDLQKILDQSASRTRP